MKETQSSKRRLSRLPAVERKPVSASQEGWVETSYLQPEQSIPLVIRPAVDGLNLIEWSGRNRSYIETLLLEHGALLFRGFDVHSTEAFEQFTKATAGELYEYRERSSPRTEVGNKIYTSTDYPADRPIFLHNEHSYSREFPLKIYFFGALPAQEGGETPIADCRKVLHHIDSAVKERFLQKGWRYVRNFGEGFGLPWQTVFQTDNKAEVERYCRENRIEFEWKNENRLRTSQVRPVIAIHPKTDEPVWFNHATFFHVTTLETDIQAALRREFIEEDLPNNTYYGDGSPIEPEVMAMLRQAYLREKVLFPWQKGDILMLDNMLTAHAREPFKGPRQILVGMADIYSRQDV